MENLNWQKKESLGIETNILQPMLQALKETLQNEKSQLEIKLNNLKKLGIVSVNKQELNQKLEEMKFKK
jgi:hypothetical protein